MTDHLSSIRQALERWSECRYTACQECGARRDSALAACDALEAERLAYTYIRGLADSEKDHLRSLIDKAEAERLTPEEARILLDQVFAVHEILMDDLAYEALEAKLERIAGGDNVGLTLDGSALPPGEAERIRQEFPRARIAGGDDGD